MSNYTQSTNFTALTTAHAVINGAAYDLEYGAVSTAIASKFDNLAGGYTGPFTMNALAGSITLTVNGASGQFAQQINGNASSGNSRGLSIAAGTTAADFALVISNQASTTTFLNVSGNGSVTVGSPTGSGQGIGTINVSGGFYVNGVVTGLGSTVLKTVASNETRTSNTVLSNSTFLTYAIPAAGTYVIRAVIAVSSAGTGGVAANLNYSGTFTSSVVNSYVGGSVLSGWGGTIASAVTTAQISANGTATNWILTITGTLVATGTGTVAVAWAQSTSNATATNFNAGSTMTVDRIA